MIELREFQKNTKDNLMEGKSTVVIAPTGLGKTIAAILPFVETLSNGGNNKLRSRIVYSLPIRALAKGVQEEFENFNIKAIIHHGDEPESKWFTERAIITTVDQYFTAFAGAQLSWSSATSHAAAGAALANYTVFDEIHLLNPKNGLQLLFAVLKLRNRWNLPTTVMTATLPNSVINFLETKCGLVKIGASEKDIRDRDSWREVSLKLHDVELDVEGLVGFVKGHLDNYGKAIVFVNTVERAISLYKKLKEDSSLKNKILLAHSRFTKKHRKRIEEEIHLKFGRDSDFEGILVTTQVAEAGLNISAPLVITELAPMDSLIQRAGRCVRFKENSGKVKGEVIVVKPKVENGRWYAPYFDYIRLRKGGSGTNKNDAFIKNKERITLSELTWVVLLEKAKTNISLDWNTEKELLNLSLDDVYSAFINGSDIIYFKDQLKDKELGEIIEQYKDELKGG
ncbi:MAG: CRISPR-associated helicase Cas3' [Candidatus Aenigmarchaeota archaeon]|nr:CRISPR-associated helicase Cas3' [Candidatus Aenigmarchaeota archaeon]